MGMFAAFEFFEYSLKEWYGMIDTNWFKYQINGQEISTRGKYDFQRVNISSVRNILLFNLKDDPMESINIAENNTEIIISMVHELNNKIDTLVPQRVTIAAMMMEISEEIKKIILSVCFICFFCFLGFGMTVGCLLYLII